MLLPCRRDALIWKLRGRGLVESDVKIEALPLPIETVNTNERPRLRSIDTIGLKLLSCTSIAIGQMPSLEIPTDYIFPRALPLGVQTPTSPVCHGCHNIAGYLLRRFLVDANAPNVLFRDRRQA